MPDPRRADEAEASAAAADGARTVRRMKAVTVAGVSVLRGWPGKPRRRRAGVAGSRNEDGRELEGEASTVGLDEGNNRRAAFSSVCLSVGPNTSSAHGSREAHNHRSMLQDILIH